MFHRICVLGTCKTTTECIDLVLERSSIIELFDVNEKASPYLKKYAENKKIAYCSLKKKEVFEYIDKIEEKCLILSIVNPYIIPDYIVKKENVCAINLHHALLPKHPGRNGECWAIYEQDELAGITWHFIDTKVDTGNIIDQRSIRLDDSITALRLFETQNAIAVESLKGFADELFAGTLKGKPQDKSIQHKLHYSYEKPNKGILDFSWDTKKISSFLRSMDYGPLRSMGYALVEYQDVTYKVVKYTIQTICHQSTSGIYLENNILKINKPDAIITLKIKNHYAI